MEDPKDKKITAEEVYNKAFATAQRAGYEPTDVDNFLDRVVKTLSSYEESFRRHREIEKTFNDIVKKTELQDLTIKKLQSELKTMYDNGYANQAMMRRIQSLEEKISGNTPETEQRLQRIESVLQEILIGLTSLVQKIS